jgi:hypothetical protein
LNLLLNRDAEAVRILTAEPALPEAIRRAERWYWDRQREKQSGDRPLGPKWPGQPRDMAKRKQHRTPDLSEQLREFILHGGLSRYAISRASGVDQSQLHRFLYGTGRLTTDSLDAVRRVLRLRLVQDSE